jgi:hypothetical protein
MLHSFEPSVSSIHTVGPTYPYSGKYEQSVTFSFRIHEYESLFLILVSLNIVPFCQWRWLLILELLYVSAMLNCYCKSNRKLAYRMSLERNKPYRRSGTGATSMVQKIRNSSVLIASSNEDDGRLIISKNYGCRFQVLPESTLKKQACNNSNLLFFGLILKVLQHIKACSRGHK